jgi:hypothetical protein
MPVAIIMEAPLDYLLSKEMKVKIMVKLINKINSNIHRNNNNNNKINFIE